MPRAVPGDGGREKPDGVADMQVTQYSDYALRTLIYLGLNGDRRCTAGEIADAYGISENHLTKVIHRLGREGFVATIRGRNGGLELAMPPGEIGLGDVFRATEGSFELVECFADGERNGCPISGPCVLTHVLEAALDAFLGVLDRHTLEDLLRPRDALKLIFAARAARAGTPPE